MCGSEGVGHRHDAIRAEAQVERIGIDKCRHGNQPCHKADYGDGKHRVAKGAEWLPVAVDLLTVEQTGRSILYQPYGAD